MITKSVEEEFSRESSRANFNQVHNSATDIFFTGDRMREGGILSKSCSGKLCKIHRKTSATESIFIQIVGLLPASY